MAEKTAPFMAQSLLDLSYEDLTVQLHHHALNNFHSTSGPRTLPSDVFLYLFGHRREEPILIPSMAVIPPGIKPRIPHHGHDLIHMMVKIHGQVRKMPEQIFNMILTDGERNDIVENTDLIQRYRHFTTTEVTCSYLDTATRGNPLARTMMQEDIAHMRGKIRMLLQTGMADAEGNILHPGILHPSVRNALETLATELDAIAGEPDNKKIKTQPLFKAMEDLTPVLEQAQKAMAEIEGIHSFAIAVPGHGILTVNNLPVSHSISADDAPYEKIEQPALKYLWSIAAGAEGGLKNYRAADKFLRERTTSGPATQIRLLRAIEALCGEIDREAGITDSFTRIYVNPLKVLLAEIADEYREELILFAREFQGDREIKVALKDLLKHIGYENREGIYSPTPERSAYNLQQIKNALQGTGTTIRENHSFDFPQGTQNNRGTGEPSSSLLHPR